MFYVTSCESYLNKISFNKYKFALSLFGLRSHNLALETGRYYNIPKENRICTFCNMNKIESEYHFLLVCPLYAELRRQYLHQFYCRWPSLTKFQNLMQSKSERVIKRLSKYIFFAQNKRNLSAKHIDIQSIFVLNNAYCYINKKTKKHHLTIYIFDRYLSAN